MNLKIYFFKIMIMIIGKNGIAPMAPVEGDDEEVKKAKGLKILTPNKLLTRLPIILAQIKIGNNSNNLKTKSDKFYVFCINTIKAPKNFIKN